MGIEPWCVAITPNNAKVYVTNMASGTVSVINATTRAVIKTDPGGHRALRLRAQPGRQKLYVRESVLGRRVAHQHGSTDVVIKTSQAGRPQAPRASRSRADGTKVYVTQFLSQSRPTMTCAPDADRGAPTTAAWAGSTVLDGVGNRPIARRSP